MKLETLKIKSKNNKRIGISFLAVNKNLYLELGLGKLTILIGFLK